MTLALGALAFALASGSSASAADPSQPGSANASSAMRDAVSALEPEARERWSDSYGGLWANEDGSFSVAFTDRAPARVADLGERVPEPDLLRPVSVEHSLTELEARQRQIAADRGRAEQGRLAGIPARYDLDIDVERNAVVVLVEDAGEETIAAIQGRYGGDVIVESGPLPEPTCTPEDCRTELRSGLQTDAPWSTCSTGFTAQLSDGSRHVLSASHCGNTGICSGMDEGEKRYHGGERYGVVRAEHCHGRADTELHTIENSLLRMLVLPSWVGQPWIYVNGSNRAVRVTGQASWDSIVVDSTRVCKSGVRSGKTCGLVTSKHYSPWWVPNGNRFVRSTACVIPGDSGAGFYRADNWGLAVGIASGGHDLPCSSWNSSHSSIAGHIDYALAVFGATLTTG